MLCGRKSVEVATSAAALHFHELRAWTARAAGEVCRHPLDPPGRSRALGPTAPRFCCDALRPLLGLSASVMDAFDFDTSPGVPVIAPGLQQIAQQAISVPDHVVPLPMPPAAAPAPPPSRKGKASGSADDKPFVCSHATCDKAFARKSDLIRHNRIVRLSPTLR